MKKDNIKNLIITRVIPVAFAILAVIFVYRWINFDAAKEITLRVPGQDNTPQEISDEGQSKEITGKLTKFDGVPSNIPGAWPRFRGPNFDAISVEDIKLSKKWPQEGPKVLWSLELGEGHAGAAVLNGMVYIIDYDRENKADSIRCFSFDDGKEIWRYSYPVKIKRNHGMSRTMPAVTDKYIVTIGPKCHVTCLDPLTGQFKWMLDLVKEFGTKVPPWYAGQCPLIDEEGRAIIAPCGDALMVALDCETGQIAWKTPNPRGWKMTHSSIVPMEFNGRKMYLYCGSGGVAGVAADDGTLLWDSTEWRIKIATIATPLVVGDGKIFLSGGYNSGSMMIRLTEDNGTINTETVFRLDAEIFGSPQHTPIFYGGYIYGVRPSEEFVCLDLKGNIVWTSTSANKFGLGPYLVAGEMIYIMDDEGVLTLIEASPDGYDQLSRAKMLDGHDSWGPMSIVSGRLILRDLTKMICIDVSE